MKRLRTLTMLFAGIILLSGCQTKQPARPESALKQWNEGDAKSSIMNFIQTVSTPGSADYVEPAARIAVFDNDGTLWSEQPLYVQAVFIFDRVEELAPEHPEWKTQEPFASVLKGDMKGALAGGEHAIIEMMLATHAGMTSEEFSTIASEWIATARHPKTGYPYTDMVYQPMLEIIDALKANDFKVYIVSGGGIEFMRPWTEAVYGIPAEQVIGSSMKAEYKVLDGKPVIQRLPEIGFIDDKEGKPVGIQHHIGRRPLMAFGNSDGDFQMLEWTTAGEGKRLGVLIHHDDAERETAYDRDSHIGRLDRGLDEADDRGWLVVSMKNDFKRIFLNE